MKKSSVIAVFCMVLIVTLPLVVAQSQYSSSSQSLLPGYQPNEVAFFQQPSSLADLLGGAFSQALGTEQDLGEALVIYAATPDPPFIRASALEQQPLPIYIPLRATDFGSILGKVSEDPSQRDPFTGFTSLPPVKRMVVKLNRTNPFVNTIKYIPPESGFSKDNMGYLVVVLNRLRNETSLPTARSQQTSVFNNSLPQDVVPNLGADTPVIDLDLTAEIYLNLQESSLTNLGQRDLVLKPESENDFLKKSSKEENAFYNDRAYVRASAIGQDRVTLNVYNKDLLPLTFFSAPNAPAGSKVASVSLTTNQVSSPVRLGISSNPLQDSVVFKLNNVVLPANSVSYQLSTSSQTFEREANEGSFLYPGSHWQIISVKKNERDATAEQVRKQGFTLDSASRKKVEQAQPGDIKIVSYQVFLKNSATGESRSLEREVVTGSTFNFDFPPLDDATALALEEMYCPSALQKTANEDYGCAAVRSFKQVINDYPASAEAKSAYGQLVDVYDNDLISNPACKVIGKDQVLDEDKCSLFLDDMFSLAYYYASKVKVSNPVLLQKLRDGFGGKGGFEFLEDEGIGFQVKNVKIATNDDKGKFSLSVNRNPLVMLQVGNTIPNLVGTTTKGDLFKFIVRQINQNSVLVEKKKVADINLPVDEKSVSFGSLTLISGQNNVLLKKGEENQQDENVLLDIGSIEVNTRASISIIPGANRGLARSSFRVHIPIEPRPFPNLGETLKGHINATRKLVADLDSVITKMDTVVKSWKKLCIITFAFVTLKSSFLGGTTRTLARRGVAQVYKKDCATQVAATKFRSVDDCLASRTDELSKDVDANQKAIEAVQSQLSKETPDHLKMCGDVPFQEARLLGATIQDCQEYLRLKALKSEQTSDLLKIEADKSLTDLKFEQKKDLISQASKAYEDNKDKLPFKGDDAAQKGMQYYANLFEQEQQKKTPIREDVINVPSLIPNGKDTAIAILNPVFDPQTKQINPDSIKPTELKQITQLQFKIYDEGADEVVKQATVNCLQNVNSQVAAKNTPAYTLPCVQKRLNALNVPDPSGLYVNPVFIGAANQISADAAVASALSNYKDQLLVDQGSLAKKGALPKASLFKVYSSPIVPRGNELKSLDYAYLQEGATPGGLVAQYNPESGKTFCYPTGKNGEYILVLERYPENGRVRTFRAMNVGLNGVMECGGSGDDVLADKGDESTLNLPENAKLKNDYLSIVERAPTCKKDGDQAGFVFNTKGNKIPVVCSMKQSLLNAALSNPKCVDVMEPEDCKILFNVCDPVMCPASRCNLGGRYQVPDVIQSGIVGSLFLCAPNIKQGVVVPVCLTGVLAGLKNIKSLLESYADCLEANLKDGKNVGFCDYIRSVGVCELVWRESTSLLGIKGGVIDYLSDKVFSEPEGGAEYLTFQNSLQNVGSSFNYFTTEYSNTYVAALKGSSTAEVGSQICRLGVYGRLPTAGEVLDKLSEPEDPPQFFALLDEAPYTQTVGESPLALNVPASAKELSLYKVFYHIYAGTGYAQDQAVFAEPLNPATNQPNKAVTYSVVLRNREAGLPDVYMTSEGEFLQNQATIARGQYAQKTVQKVAVPGYNEVCIVLNGKEACGFGKVSSSFSLNYLNDRLVESDSKKKITSSEQCVPNVPTSGVALGSLATPEKYGVTSTGISRVCNPTPPTADLSRWADVGSCGKDKNGIDRGTCWLDKNSVRVQDLEAKKEINVALKQSGLAESEKSKVLSSEDSVKKLSELNTKRDSILAQLRAAVQRLAGAL